MEGCRAEKKRRIAVNPGGCTHKEKGKKERGTEKGRRKIIQLSAEHRQREETRQEAKQPKAKQFLLSNSSSSRLSHLYSHQLWG